MPTADPSPPVEPSPSVTASAEPTASPAPVTIIYELSAGQQSGKLVGDAIPIYRLVLPDVGAGENSPHGGTGQNGSDCAACHAGHTSQQANLLAASNSQAAVCYACHKAGLGAADIAAEFSDAPANDPSSASYYGHPVNALNDDALTCADCHNPHLSGIDRPAQSTTGWTADGPTAAARGIAVANGAAGSEPIYTPITHGLATYEYELCLSCHSGSAAANLPTRDTAHPSWWALDAGIEFNPANASYHPVEGVGRNATAQMAASLAGTSPFKAWSFGVDSTVRCSNCHGDPTTVNQVGSGTPLTPAADALEASHASPNRGLLTAPYRDRTLKATGEAYAAEDFGLCYLCHAERPFVDPNVDPGAPDTSFPLHGIHLAGTAMKAGLGEAGAGLSIDTLGDGQGLATCSECHFRSHATAVAYRPGDTAPVARANGATGLVNFAPNVRGVGLIDPTWAKPTSLGQGSCTLTCHGYTHTAATQTYSVAPAAGFTWSQASGLVIVFSDATRYADTITATWSWDFGDGASSTVVSPSHTYAAPGTYAVSLTVQRLGLGGLSTTMTRSVVVVAP